MLRDSTTLTQAQIADLQATTAAIESTYQKIRRMAATIAILYQQGQATCGMIRDYNLMAIAIFNTQQGMLSALASAGQTGLPAAPTAPTLFLYTDSTGASSTLVSCTTDSAVATGITSSDGTISGPRYPRGARATAGTIPPGRLAVSTIDPNWMNPQAAPRGMAGALGEIPLIVLVIAGIVISVVLIEALQALASYLTQASVAKTQAKALDDMANARLKCYQACIDKSAASGSAPSCAAACTDAFPQPSVYPPAKASDWGFFSLIGLGALAAVVGGLLYRKYNRDGYILPRAHAVADE